MISQKQSRPGSCWCRGEGPMRRREPWSTATLEEGGPAPTAHYEGIFRRLSRHRGRLIAYSLVFEDPASIQEPDSDTDSDGPGPGPRVGIGRERGGPPLEGPTAELEWDPTGDVGWLGALRSRRVWTPGSPCEVCGRAEPLAVWSHRPWGPSRSSFHTQDREQPSLRNVTVQIPLGSGGHKEGGARPRWTRRTLLFLLLLLLLGVACLLPPPGGPHCPPPRLRGPLHLVLNYVNGPPPT
ncbi:nesprin-4 [Phascolarctos cinereus]|uniref:Nesprin-4 n=1 Tax=Phascolarctos cinereus TaxID=38626 RepID=A0A6P5JIX7_PHACI|nr:nesprin-4 [Phascolarctos cinereus]XP_020833332.1 nesprin-4 [Phascolarctos cinereus]XP_020833335.1 nesprin-4 [Phascolarctos cinereus]